MRDRYIDDEEMESYGTQFAELIGPLAKKDAFVKRLAAAVAKATSAESSKATTTGDQRTTLSGAVKKKASALDRANAELSKLSLVVRSEAANFPQKAFFPKGRYKVGKAPKRVKAAVKKCLAALKKYPKFPGAAARRASFTTLQSELTTAIKGTDASRQAARTETPALQQTRARWKRVWRAAKLGVEATLLLASDESVTDELESYFPDMTGGRAPRPRKKKNPGSGGTGSTPSS